MSEALRACQLKAMVVTVGAGGELRDGAKPRIRRLRVGERGKAALAHRLITVDLRRVRLVHRARADVLRAHAACRLRTDVRRPGSTP